ncbi:MAG: phosphoribosylaminoimidazolesuccinocarboxamide synthase, partial [Acidobacteriaceae bacterium]
MPTLIATEFQDLQLYARGKVRDLYAVGDLLLLVATDRISAFDHVLATGIPGKGRVLTQISLFWFDYLSDIVPNHLVTANVKEYPPLLRLYEEELEGRSMLVNCARMFPAECVVRGYLSGSGWKDYARTGKICGIALPPGLRESE